MLKKIIQLSTKIDSTHLVSSSYNALNSLKIDKPLGSFEEEIKSWLLENAQLPDQLNVFNSFGQPPITLFNNDHFVIDLYFWTHYDTSIHSHSFSGAFKVLYGQSLHEVFQTKKIESFTDDIELNEMNRLSSNILKQGDLHKIESGQGFCHRVIHLNQPTVSLCIRSINDTQADQWHYFENGLSLKKKEITPSNYKKIFYYQYLLGRDEQGAQFFLESFLNSLSLSQSMNIFEQLQIDGLGLDEFPAEKMYELLYSAYEKSSWFKLYIDYYEKAASFIEPEVDTPKDRLMAHAANSEYSKEEVDILLKALL